MGQRKYNKKLLFGVILFLIIINTVALIISGCNGRDFLINILLYVIEIIVTIWIIIGDNVNGW